MLAPQAMATDKILTCALVFLACFIAKAGTVTLEARVDMLGIRGPVTFFQNAPGEAVSVSFALSGIPSDRVFYWTIRNLYVNYDQSERCTDSIGAIIAGGAEVMGNVSIPEQTVTGIELSGATSIAGASIMIQDSSSPLRRACATILPVTSMITAHALFLSNIAGDVHFRQSLDMPTSGTIVYTDMFNVDGHSPTGSLFWEIYIEAVDEDDIDARCNALQTIYNPSTASDSGCTSSIHTNCIVGDLTSKLGGVSVSTVKGLNRLRYVDNNLPLTGSSSIIGKTLAILTADKQILACATINRINTRTVRATLYNDGAEGYIEFIQLSPFDATQLSINLPYSSTLGYHIHEYPVSSKLSNTDSVCSADSVAEPFNPHVVANGLISGTGDHYALGDLSGKSSNSVFRYVTDWYMPLFGRNSIVGRALVVRLDTDWACANIIYKQDVDVMSAIVRFTYPVIGFMLFQQLSSESWSDTSVYGELDYADDSGATFDHSWHVHVKHVGEDFQESIGQRCQSAEGHYNPLRVSLSDSYATECSGQNMLRCELGDLANKHGQIDIRSIPNGAKKFYFIDINLPLSGSRSIIGRSVVIHDKDSAGARLACASISMHHPVTVEVSRWSGAPHHALFEMTQGTTLDPVRVTRRFSSLYGSLVAYKIHELPLPPHGICSESSLGGLYNPLNVHPDRMTSIPFSAYDELSTTEDNSLSLMGPLSVVGRSVLIYRVVDETGILCGNITHKLTSTNLADRLPSTSWIQKASAKFDQGGIRGMINMSQIQYDDGTFGDTQIYIDLSYVDSARQTVNHGWHTHEFPISVDDVGCTSAGGHYNPFHVSKGSGYEECGLSNPWRCEVGDQAGKLSRYNIGGGKKLYNDVNLPLTGDFSVIGRSFVVHEEDGGGPRLVCANIFPDDAPSLVMKFLNPRPLDKADFSQVISRALNADPWMVTVNVPTMSHTECLDVDVFFAGRQAMMLKERLSRMMIERTDAILGRYRPRPESECNPILNAGMAVGASMALVLTAQLIMAGYRRL